MNKINRYIAAQCGKPQGIIGALITTMQNIVNAAMYRKAISLVNVSADENVLDIGYGNGHLLKLLYRKTHCDLYGIDISDDAKVMARRKNQAARKAGKLHLHIGDCCNLPYRDEMFSAVTSINTVYFWSDTLKGLTEIRRTLKTGKSFYNILYTRDFLDQVQYTQIGFKKFEPKQLAELGKQGGFRKIAVRRFSRNAFVVIYTK